MSLLYLLIGAVLMFGAGELYGLYKLSKDRRTLWMCIAGVLISVINFISALGVAQ